MSDLETRIRDVLHEDASRAPLVPRMPESVRPRVRRRQTGTIVTAALAAVAVVAVSVVAIGALDRDRTGPAPVPASQTPTPTPPAWSPVQERDVVVVHAGTRLNDPHEASVGWIDVERLSYSGGRQPHWHLQLAGKPPLAEDLEPGRLIAYGLVLDANGDGVADYLVGIDNDAPNPGDFRTWVTDLATGETTQHVGPPYGFPVEFGHPDESRPADGPRPPTMTFTFLPGTAPADLDPATVRFYAWASETRDGEVIAWDTAPDDGWMTGR